MEAASNHESIPLMEKAETYIKGLALLQPVYVQGGGDMTGIGLANGTMRHDPRPVPTVIKQIARYFGVDLTAVREQYGGILGKKLHVPLPLSPQIVLVPFKMRTPLVAKDGTTGYVVMSAIEQVIPLPSSTCCLLEVKGIGRVEVLQSSDFANQQLRNAMIVYMFYSQRMQLPPSERLTFSSTFPLGQTNSVARYF